MAGLLAISWSAGRESEANELFDRACEAHRRLKGLSKNADVRCAGFRVARFAGRNSPFRDVYRNRDSTIIVASAGWWSLRSSDRAVPSLAHVAELYEREQEAVLNRFLGHYLMAIVDVRGQFLVASPDRLGFYPSYVVERDGIAWLSTSSTVLASVLKPALDTGALRALFMDDAIRSPRTAFDGIRRLSVGEQATIRDGRAAISRAWVPYTASARYHDIREAAEHGVSILRESFRSLGALYTPFACDLTAGLDSRLVVGAAAEREAPLSVTVNGDGDHPDVACASRIADHFGWQCMNMRLPADWGTARWPFFRKAAVLSEGELVGDSDTCLAAKERLAGPFRASVTGGMGEMCRDFFWQQEFPRIGRTSSLDVARLFRYRFFFHSRPELSLFRRDWRAEYISEQARLAREVVELSAESLNTAKLDAIYIWKNAGHTARYIGTSYPVLPTIAPMGTQPFIEYCLSVPYQYRLGGRLVRHMIARAHPALARFPTWYGGSAEPFRVAEPRNYVPYYANLLRKGLRKVSQMTINRALCRDPCARRVEPGHDNEFVRVLDGNHYLDIDQLTSATLYDSDGLRNFLRKVLEPGFKSFSQLYAIVFLELLCRETGITPAEQSL